MLMRMPGSVGLYHAEALTPLGEAEPPPLTFRLMHYKTTLANCVSLDHPGTDKPEGSSGRRSGCLRRAAR